MAVGHFCWLSGRSCNPRASKDGPGAFPGGKVAQRRARTEYLSLTEYFDFKCEKAEVRG